MRIVEYLLPNLSREIVSSKFSYAKCKVIHNKGKLRSSRHKHPGRYQKKKSIIIFLTALKMGIHYLRLMVRVNLE